jgi:dephospho-CoA kinase
MNQKYNDFNQFFQNSMQNDICMKSRKFDSMKRIGLTGGIGSGKSYVAKVIEAMGYPVYYSDSRSKELSNEDPHIREQLISEFGEEVYSNGVLNKQFLAKKIYSNDSARSTVNAIIHPIVRDDFSSWADAHSSNALIFNEAAILFEMGTYTQFDSTILVYAPEHIKIERIVQRDHISIDEIRQKMKTQWNDADKLKLTPHHILNDGNAPLLNQIEHVIEKISQ